jgi:hypothetical protein
MTDQAHLADIAASTCALALHDLRSAQPVTTPAPAGCFLAVLLLVAGVCIGPLLLATADDLCVFRVRGEFGAVVVCTTAPLAFCAVANGLVRAVLRGFERLLGPGLKPRVSLPVERR